MTELSQLPSKHDRTVPAPFNSRAYYIEKFTHRQSADASHSLQRNSTHMFMSSGLINRPLTGPLRRKSTGNAKCSQFRTILSGLCGTVKGGLCTYIRRLFIIGIAGHPGLGHNDRLTEFRRLRLSN
jgi:hypothetical protein